MAEQAATKPAPAGEPANAGAASRREPVIVDAVAAPGHDGAAQLVVRVRYENGAVGSVTLDADAARKLFADCAAESPSDLCGQPWRRLLGVLPRDTAPSRSGGVGES